MICASDAFLPHAPWQTLDFEEFCALVKEREVGSHSTYALEQRFKALDANDSGRIEMHEYLMFSLRDALARSITRVIELLQSWDSDKSGDISKKEFRKAVRALGFSDARDRECATAGAFDHEVIVGIFPLHPSLTIPTITS